MSRRPLISGNWKENYTHLDAIAVVQKLAFGLDGEDTRAVDVAIHPPFTALRSVQTVLEADKVPVALGAQDVHWENTGAYTGAVGPTMLAKLSVRYVIVGHSERRHWFAESDDMVNRKLVAVLAAGMTPVLCVGESAEQRRSGHGDDIVLAQVRAGLAGVDPEAVGRSVVAYEPLWAIGNGNPAMPADAEATARAIRGLVTADFGAGAGDGVRIQYGGSVNAGTIADLMAQPDIDGALVGGASLDPGEFTRIVVGARR